MAQSFNRTVDGTQRSAQAIKQAKSPWRLKPGEDPRQEEMRAAYESPQAPKPSNYQRPAHAPDCPCMVCGIGRQSRAKDPE